MLPNLVLSLLDFVSLPKKIEFFRKTVNVEEEIEFNENIDFSAYKNLLNSDFTILFGVALIKNPRLKKIELSNLNLYDVDIQVLVNNIPKLTNLQKLSFKRSTFMDNITNLDQVLI